MEYGEKLENIIQESTFKNVLDSDLAQVVNDAGMLLASQTSGYKIENITKVDHALVYGYRNNKRPLQTIKLGTAIKLASFPYKTPNEACVNVIDKLRKVSSSSFLKRPTWFSRTVNVPRKQLKHLESLESMQSMNIVTAMKILSFFQKSKGTAFEIR